MGMTKEKARRVTVTLHYPQPSNGDGPTVETYDVYTFPCRRRKNAEAKAAAGEVVLSELPPNVVKLAGLLIEEPTGFDDFPSDERPLDERALEYFSDPDMEVFATHAVSQYYRLTMPEELFRALQDS